MSSSANCSDERRTSSVNGHRNQDAEEIQIPMPWGHVSGKWWGPKDEQPVICLHGWQDNAGTFDKLAPFLSGNVALLGLDLVGHGHSSHLPTGQFNYVFWDGILLLRRVVNHYNWDKLSHGYGFLCLEHENRGVIVIIKPNALRSKWWGSRGVQPIVALHGRQDNAGSFDNLVPSLSNELSFLCLDMPGHGLSSHLPNGGYYYVYWDGVQLLRRVFKHFKWTKIKILGHSLGGAIGFLYAATFPDEVESLICLDIASPTVKNLSQTVATTGDHIEKFLKYETLTLDNVPCYEYKEMIDLVEHAYHGSITRDSAEVLMKRGMMPAPTPGRHYFSRDPRLKSSLLGMLSMDLVMTYASRIKCAYLNIRAVPGLRFDDPGAYEKVVNEIKRNARKFEYQEVPGSHHVHLNEPEKVAPIINAFLTS